VKRCEILTRGALTNRYWFIREEPLDFAQAREVADQKSTPVGCGSMLLAWYEAKSGKFRHLSSAGSEAKPGWIVYAESRGGTITIDINDEEYILSIAMHQSKRCSLIAL